MGETPLHQEPVSVIRQDEVGNMLVGTKDYLRGVTRANTVTQDQDHILMNGVYTVRESDVQGLLYYILGLAGQLGARGPQGTITTASETEYSSTRAPMSIRRPVSSTAVDPATTIAVSEASFTPAVGTYDRGPQRSQTATTATLISQDSVTQITWLHPRGSAPVTDPVFETTFEDPSPGTPDTTDQPKKAETSRTLDHAALPYPERRIPVDRHHSVTVNYMPGSFTGNNIQQRRQSSMVVVTNGNELDREGDPQSGEESGQKTNVLGRIRKKSIQFGQALGSFMNGAYRNADHKPRRDSS